ncbi:MULTISPECIES: helix-turn-helix domain-containing protein [Clostridia]|uniref:PucR family transcriptional regulator n=1 Tax=Clostridia TaxID=186801 RepID=UPI000EA3FE56|nr:MULTISPECIES: helix-turn-helix domain-containing protein [Clostridia]NBJ69125.1 hypothetical protein [Roseburia sp. 1XD42-34]RKI79549.1 hypothetical protein D7V87_06495 [Clostridium sp. 1xD42-85]
MIQQLKKIFPELIIEPENSSPSSLEYKWFLLENREKIGIPLQNLTDKDLLLLETFLTPYQADFPIPTEKELKWKQLLQQTDNNIYAIPQTPYRFVYFAMNKEQIDPLLFKESIQALFAYQVPILWENRHEGIIIEEKPPILEESIPYDQIIDVIMNDLSVNIHFLVGPYLNSYQDATDQYKRILTYAKTTFTYSNKAVLNYHEALPYILLEQVDESFQNHLSQVVLQEFSNDNEFLQTIHTFLQYNLNISVTAKKLYMHRNSLQYRLDKFIENTGIDIRQFHQAVTVYFALLANMHKD